MKGIIGLCFVGAVIGLLEFAQGQVLQNVGGLTSVGGAAVTQTPWTADIDGGGFQLTNTLSIQSATLRLSGSASLLSTGTNKISGLLEFTNAANATANKVGYVQQDAFGYFALSGTTGTKLGHGNSSSDVVVESAVMKPPNDLQTDLGQSNVRFRNYYGSNVTTIVLTLSTNYVAADFTPIAGSVRVVSSNGVLWKVTQLTTNLLSQNIP